MPGRLIVHAIEAADLTQGTGLTPLVAAAVDEVASAVLGDISRRADAGEPGSELAGLSGPAEEADVAVGPDDDDAAAGDAGQAVNGHEPARRQVLEPVRVAVEQDVHAGPGQQLVQPDAPPARVDEPVGQPVSGAETAGTARRRLHRQGAAAVAHVQL